MVKKQKRKIYVSLIFILLWLCSLMGTAFSTPAASGKTEDRTSYTVAKVTTPAGLPGEEELSRTYFGGDIKLLPSGLPVPEFTGMGAGSLYQNIRKIVHRNNDPDLRHHIEQLIFPFHFFY